MDRNVAEEIYGACERALAELSIAEQAINRIGDDDERKQFLLALARTIAEILGTLRGPVVREYPDFEPPPELGEPDTLLDEEEPIQQHQTARAQALFVRKGAMERL